MRVPRIAITDRRCRSMRVFHVTTEVSMPSGVGDCKVPTVAFSRVAGIASIHTDE